jgi:chromatin remodeling complex protein RSC6
MKFKISKDLQNTLKLPSSVPRTVVTKKVWAHIKSKKLQDPKNRRDIVLDDNLAKLFSKKRGDIVNMFKLQKHLNKHYL